MVRRRGPRPILLVAWVVLLAGVLGVLHVLGRGPLRAPPVTRPGALAAWLDHESAAPLAFSAVRLAAMGLAWYLLATTLAGLVARLAGSARWSAAVDACSPGVVRRLVHGAAGLSVGATITGTPAAAWAAVDGQPTPASPVPIMRQLPSDPSSAPVAAPPATAPPATAPPATASPASWVIRPGDNLWSVALTTLARARGWAPTDAEVDRYWAGLIAANRARLANREDPDLVFPGQVFQLPPTTD